MKFMKFLKQVNVAFCKICGKFIDGEDGSICSSCLGDDDFPYGG